MGSLIDIGKTWGKTGCKDQFWKTGSKILVWGILIFIYQLEIQKSNQVDSWTLVDRSRDTSLSNISEKIRYIFYFSFTLIVMPLNFSVLELLADIYN